MSSSSSSNRNYDGSDELATCLVLNTGGSSPFCLDCECLAYSWAVTKIITSIIKHVMQAYGGVELYIHVFLISALDAGE
jgi:hypothetical protein